MPGAFRIEFDQRDLQNLMRIGQQFPPEATKLMAMEFWRNLRIEAPVDTGRLAGSFQIEPTGPMDFRVTSGVSYATYVLEGTRPHTIRPRNKQALYWPGAAHPVRSVRHPGTQPNPYVNRAWQRTEQRAQSFAQQALNGLT